MVTAELHNVVVDGNRLIGHVKNDAAGRFRDGAELRTSPIMIMGMNDGELTAITLNTIYLVKSWRSIDQRHVEAYATPASKMETLPNAN